MTQVPQVSDAQSSQVKDKGCPLERSPIHPILIDRDIVDKDVPHAHANPVPISAGVDQSPKDDGVAAGKRYKVVVRMLSPHRYDMRCDAGSGIHTRGRGISNDLGSPPCCDLKKVVAKILNGVMSPPIVRKPVTYCCEVLFTGSFTYAIWDRQKET